MDYLNHLGVEKFPEENARQIFAQMARGVQEIHNQGIVHCDLKHMNIFVTEMSSETPKIKIGDFGLACKLEKDECMITRSGTIGFMAPEVVLE